MSVSTSASTTPILIAGAITLALAFGARSVFGLVVDPLSAELGWPRETFALSLAIQNLVWGLAQPLFGMIADRFGDRRALWLGLICYLAGMALSAVSATPLGQHLGAGVLVGAGVAGTAFGLVLAIVGRATPEEKRSQALGMVSALGSAGMVVLPLVAAAVIAAWGWRGGLIATGALLLPIAFCIPYLRAPALAPRALDEAALGETLRRAFGHNSYLLLVAGFFVCGFHVAFIAAHFPAYVADVCSSFTLLGAEVTPSMLGAASIAIIGAVNIASTMVAGQLGARYRKPWLLSAIYALRAVVILAFVLAPPSPLSVVLFSLAMGALWLSTVPLTSALVATMFGPRYMGTLYGFVFLSHQIGSFAGVWLGGRLFDLYGSYDMVWATAIALGVFSAIVHLPVQEKPWAARTA